MKLNLITYVYQSQLWRNLLQMINHYHSSFPHKIRENTKGLDVSPWFTPNRKWLIVGRLIARKNPFCKQRRRVLHFAASNNSAQTGTALPLGTSRHCRRRSCGACLCKAEQISCKVWVVQWKVTGAVSAQDVSLQIIFIIENRCALTVRSRCACVFCVPFDVKMCDGSSDCCIFSCGAVRLKQRPTEPGWSWVDLPKVFWDVDSGHQWVLTILLHVFFVGSNLHVNVADSYGQFLCQVWIYCGGRKSTYTFLTASCELCAINTRSGWKSDRGIFRVEHR